MAIDVLSSHKTSYTASTIYGIKQSLMSNLELKDVSLVSTNDTLRSVRQNFVNKGSNAFPYSYIKIISLGIIKDRLNNKNIGRFGTGISTSNASTGTVSKSYQFHVRLNFTFHYFTSDYTQLISMVERILILNNIQGFNFRMDMPKDTTWVASMYSESEDITLEEVDLDDSNAPSVYSLELDMVCESRLSVIKDVAKVNNKGDVITRYLINNQEV